MPPTSLNEIFGRSTSVTSSSEPASQAVRTFPSTTSLLGRFRAVVRADAEPSRELEIRDRRIRLDRLLVLPHRALDIAGPEQQAGVKHRRLGGDVALLDEVFDDHHGGGVFPLLVERAGETDFQLGIVGSRGQRGFEFAFRLIPATGG
jgi:hypothetical protein